MSDLLKLQDEISDKFGDNVSVMSLEYIQERLLDEVVVDIQCELLGTNSDDSQSDRAYDKGVFNSINAVKQIMGKEG